MPYRREVFANREFYHICNRSVGSEEIFIKPTEAERMLRVIKYYQFAPDKSFSFVMHFEKNVREQMLASIYQNNPTIEILAFALMPNHYHLILRQLVENGITEFITNIQNSFAKYFNMKYNRHGALFSNRFKAVQIETESQLIHVVRYVDLNPVTAFIIDIDELAAYPYTSFTSYMGIRKHDFLTTDFILEHFKGAPRYMQFVFNQAGYQRALGRIKKFVLD